MSLIPDNQVAPPPTAGDGALIFKHHYDREDEVETKAALMNLIKSVQEWSVRNMHPEIPVRNEDGTETPYILPIRDTVAIGEIRKVFSNAKYLLEKYKEFKTAEEAGKYIEFLTTQRELDTLSTLRNLEMLSNMLAVKLGIKHGFKDRTDDATPWDRTFKKKLEFPEMTEDELKYYTTIDRDWKKLAFLVTYYVVKCKGDAHILLSGPNNSGKSNTAICFLIQCNKFLREYWQVDKYNEYYINQKDKRGKILHPDAPGQKLRKFSIKKDIYVTPTSEELKVRLKTEQYQTIDINEGMEAATNLQSMKAANVELGIRRFTTRSYHNIVIWEYQVQERPTAMMLEGMNFWFQKMKKRHFILSVASTLVRKKDPYYMKELDKCRTDKEIGNWMVKVNPNFMHTFKAPKMGPKLESRFQNWYWESKDLQGEGDMVRRNKGQDYDLMVKEVWEMVNKTHTLGFIEIADYLTTKIGFNQKDVEAFMRDYGKFNRSTLWMNRKVEVVADGS